MGPELLTILPSLSARDERFLIMMLGGTSGRPRRAWPTVRSSPKALIGAAVRTPRLREAGLAMAQTTSAPFARPAPFIQNETTEIVAALNMRRFNIRKDERGPIVFRTTR